MLLFVLALSWTREIDGRDGEGNASRSENGESMVDEGRAGVDWVGWMMWNLWM